jgi:hypothetical protein
MANTGATIVTSPEISRATVGGLGSGLKGSCGDEKGGGRSKISETGLDRGFGGGATVGLSQFRHTAASTTAREAIDLLCATSCWAELAA